MALNRAHVEGNLLIKPESPFFGTCRAKRNRGGLETHREENNTDE